MDDYFGLMKRITREHLEGQGLPVPLSLKPLSYSPPVNKLCPFCGEKHTGIIETCSRCADKLASGDSR